MIAAYYHRECQTWIATAGRDGGGGFSPEDFAGHIREEYSTYSWILEEILRRADFEILEAEYLTPTRASYGVRVFKVLDPDGYPLLFGIKLEKSPTIKMLQSARIGLATNLRASWKPK